MIKIKIANHGRALTALLDEGDTNDYGGTMGYITTFKEGGMSIESKKMVVVCNGIDAIDGR